MIKRPAVHLQLTKELSFWRLLVVIQFVYLLHKKTSLTPRQLKQTFILPLKSLSPHDQNSPVRIGFQLAKAICSGSFRPTDCVLIPTTSSCLVWLAGGQMNIFKVVNCPQSIRLANYQALVSQLW